MDEGRHDEIKKIMVEYCMHELLFPVHLRYGAIEQRKADILTPGQAVRDWDLMIEYQVQAGKKLSRDLFILSSEEKLSHATMVDAGIDLNDYPPADIINGRPKVRPDLYPPQRRYVNRDRSIKAFWKRLLIALFGGTTLVGPMLIMKLHDGRATALATTSVAVFLFAICIAKFSNALPEVIVSAVAAYAAVLVVFVGVNK
jgi:hypothetical protein